MESFGKLTPLQPLEGSIWNNAFLFLIAKFQKAEVL